MALALVTQQREYFNSGQTLSIHSRRQALQRLSAQIHQHEAAIVTALHQDLHKPEFEVVTTEIALVQREITMALRALPRWMRAKRVGTPLFLWPGRSRILPTPRGVVGIIAPWNYPFQLAMLPLVGAIAAGNCAVIKPSEVASATEQVIRTIIAAAFAPQHVQVVTGGPQVTQELVQSGLDYVFFTGSTSVGKLIMQAAAPHLTPVTLELGGKSPCLVDRNILTPTVVRRIVWGKFYNTGQTCIAPDYLLIHRDDQESFIHMAKQALHEFFGADPQTSADYGRIINDHHFRRLTALMRQGQVALGGQVLPNERYIAPTILRDVTMSDPIMQEEIFGPILPLLPYRSVEEAMVLIRQQPRPLAGYIFTRNEDLQRRFTEQLPYGGGCVNDTLLHYSNDHLPFGGIGMSGLGSYHGYHSFATFSHQKALYHSRLGIDLPFKYPPYPRTFRFVRWMLGL